MSTTRLSPWRTLAALALAAALATPLHAAKDPTYTALRAAKPDGRKIPVQGLELERDAFRFKFDSGAFHLLAPVDGRTVGAVFVGQGSYRLSPATPNERRQLALSSGGGQDFETLTDNFEDLLLLFADDTAEEIQLHAPVQTGAPDPKALQVQEAWLKRQRKDFKINFHVRILQDLLNSPGLRSGVFLALVNGKKHPPALAAVDPNGAGAFGPLLGGEDTLFLVADPNKGGLWYLSDRQAEVDRKRALPEKRLADALDYRVETSIEKDTDVAGTTTARFKALVPNLRVLPFYLLPELRIGEASYAVEAAGSEPAWKPAAFIQEDKEEDAGAALIFPEPLAKDSTILLRLSYKGDEVLEDAGDKNYFVLARAAWYPDLGIFSDLATFELIYRVPADNEVISVGRKVEERSEGKQVVSVWKTDHPVQIAGFNYGKFKKLEKQDETSGILVEVYTNPGTPDGIREINDLMSRFGTGDEYIEGAEEFSGAAPGANLGTINTSKLAEATLADALNSARLFTTYFGPLPQKHVAITQQSQAFFGQSWPSLIYMPYISFLDGTQRQRLGLTQARNFVEEVGFHEFAHQWWGHLIGWSSYRDQWLSEGFAEFSSSLAVQHTKGWGAYFKFWRDRRKEILDKYPGNAIPHYQAGPITQGSRLVTPRTPSAYQTLIYAKGGYVLHMLRMLMYDPASKDPDASFIAMMKDFTSTYGNKHPSTADFQKVVERHMVPAMNATGDGKIDWFFNQWVYGTEMPRYVADLKVEKASGDEYRISGNIKQEGVSKDFRALVPIYVEFNKNEDARIGMIPMVGETSVPVDVKLKLPKKPKRALVNAHGEVLARD